VSDQRREDHRSADQRECPRLLAYREPDPQRPEHAFQHADERRLRHRDEPRSGGEEQEPDAELADAEQRE